MSNSVDIELVREDALALSDADRVALARDLLSSLDAAEADPDVEQAWAEEAERRLEEIRSCKVQPVPGEEVLRKARERLA